jgi:hypothetical protein
MRGSREWGDSTTTIRSSLVAPTVALANEVIVAGFSRLARQLRGQETIIVRPFWDRWPMRNVALQYIRLESVERIMACI